MNYGDPDHIFIFHGDDEQRPREVLHGEIVLTGQYGDEARCSDRNKVIISATDIEAIRERSAYLDSFISCDFQLPTHLWPHPALGINTANLRYVLRFLPTKAPEAAGDNQLQALSDICNVIWSLQCSREPFLDAKRTILAAWKEKKRSPSDAEVKWLSIIAFVFGQDDELKQHLEDLVWRSSGTLECPIRELREWVDQRRETSLETIFTFFGNSMNLIHRLHMTSPPVVSIYTSLTDNENKPGVGVDFGIGWASHRNERRKVFEMSPQQLNEAILDVFRREIPDFRLQDVLNGTVRQAPTQNPGFRSGKGGYVLEYFRTRRRSSREEDKGIAAIHNEIRSAEKEADNWKHLEQNEFDTLIDWRNTQQGQLLMPSRRGR